MRPKTNLLLALAVLYVVPMTLVAQEKDDTDKAARAESLRGSVTPERQWWDLKKYDLSVKVDPETQKIKGTNRISFVTLAAGDKMQIDLQKPLRITEVKYGDEVLKTKREGNVYWIRFNSQLPKGVEDSILISYQGKPIVAKRPPWSGGISWSKDENGNHFIATSCQGIGASVWWPTKDHGYDEPDDGMSIEITVPEDLVAVSNGRLIKTDHDKAANTKTYKWVVVNPINNYGVNMNIGNYVNFSETFDGEGGKLDVDYWVLDHQRETAETHFKEAPRTLTAFEHWFGKYPFYEDSYKLVVVPYLGMEHQSSVTYGNGFQNGYRGRDLSATGVGMKFDFIIVHESGHEWFGNNISMKDAADMWIHESFTNYSECLFVEYHFTEKEAQDYVIGCRRLVKNDSPVIGEYNVSGRGASGDMYYKGGNMLHSLRHTINDDEKWRSILRGLNEEFWHQTVSTEQIETYISEQANIDLELFFDQYLRTTDIPVFKYNIDGKKLTYQYDNVVDGYSYPIRVRINDEEIWLTPIQAEKSLTHGSEIESIDIDRNFYVTGESY